MPDRSPQRLQKLMPKSEFERYRIVQDRLYESDFDRFLAMEQEQDPDPAGCGPVELGMMPLS